MLRMRLKISYDDWHVYSVSDPDFEIQGLLFTPLRRKTNQEQKLFGTT